MIPPSEQPENQRPKASLSHLNWFKRRIEWHDDTSPSEASSPKAPPKLSRWFWGTIVALAFASIALTFIANWQSETKTSEHEIPRTELEKVLSEATKKTLEKVNSGIGPLVDAIYAPVYAAIPQYTDFHYSLSGEYLELTEAALGMLSTNIESRLFAGLENRLNDVASQLDDRFKAVFSEELNHSLAENLPDGMVGIPLGPSTSRVLDDAVSRIKVTAPLAGGVIGLVSLKAASKVVAKKLGTKLVTKVAGKSGAKWLLVAGGGGTGAALCSWAGPGAVVCAVGGAIFTWFTADLAVLKLDEYINREDFEAELRQLIDDDKEERKKQLENALISKAVAFEDGSAKQLADFTLSQLSGPELETKCSITLKIISQYNQYSHNLRERSPSDTKAFRDVLEGWRDDPVMGTLVREIQRNLDYNGSRLTIDRVHIDGNLPEKYRADRYVSGAMTLNGELFILPRSQGFAASGFALTASPGITLKENATTTIQLGLQQHLRLFSNRFFAGELDADLYAVMDAGEGLKQTLDLSIPIGFVKNSGETAKKDALSQTGHEVAVEFILSGASMPELNNAPNCAN